MKKLSAIALVVMLFILLGCASSSGSMSPTANSINKLNSNGPYAIQFQMKDDTLKQMLAQYVESDFGQYININNKGKGKIKVFYISHDQSNEYSKWQNSSMIMQIIGRDGVTKWRGEYNYKGGMELSGFSVNSPLEAGKLTSKRLLKAFKKDFSLR